MFSSELIIKKLIRKNISISVVESCTGGLISSNLTKIPGVSKIYYLGLVTYSNKAKQNLLKIPEKKIIKYGAVSQEIAELMVKKLYKLTHSDICISTTGIAGPGGGTIKKPTGLVFIGLRINKKIIILKKKFLGNRRNIQKKTVEFIFEYIDSLI